MKKRCGSEMCGGRQASTLSKLLRKRHPSTRYPLSPAQCTNGSPQPYPIVSFADFRRRSSRFFVTCTERAIHRAIDCKDAANELNGTKCQPSLFVSSERYYRRRC